MEAIVGMSRSQAMQDEYPPARCPNCGSRDVEIEPEETEMGFTLHPSQGICYNCGESWDT